MVHTGLLIVTNLSKIGRSLTAVKKYVSKTLYIQLCPGECRPKFPSQPVTRFSRGIAKIYSTSLQTCQQLDVIIIVDNLKENSVNEGRKRTSRPVEVLMLDNAFSVERKSELMSRYQTSNVIEFTTTEEEDTASIETKEDVEEAVEVSDNVILGGTFDRLHLGHKLMLTEAALQARKRLVVGVTDMNMIKGKTLNELILTVEERISDVECFLREIDSTLIYQVVPIQDPFGPTKYDPDLDSIIVSTETLRGGEKVNEVRAQANLNKLKIHCIDLIELETNEEGKEKKISSSNHRVDLLGTRLREPKSSSVLPLQPYIIGLVGGIASGKSAICKHFEKLGAIVINCDRMAHDMYKPGTDCYSEVCRTFGEEILNEDRTINRKVLGGLVFGKPDQLQKLNNIVWPSLLREVKIIIQRIRDEKSNEQKVVMIEAAVLLQAGWQDELHEIWSLIIPPEEALRRLVKRDHLTEEQAQQRINAQPDNRSIVSQSNVVMCTQWSYEFSQLQADKAWKSLKEHLVRQRQK